MGEPQGSHRLSKLGLSPGPLRIIPLPRNNRQRKGLEASGAVHRALGGAQSLAGDIEPLGPRQHPPPATTSTSASMASTRADGALCATTTMTSSRTTAAIVDHLREHQAAGHHIPADTFDDLQADAAENDAWIRSAGKDCRS
jgi:hypothetical protein